MKLTTKQKMLNALSKPTGRNTFTVNQARTRFGVWNVSARISELRSDGHPIVNVPKIDRDGCRIANYMMGV